MAYGFFTISYLVDGSCPVHNANKNERSEWIYPPFRFVFAQATSVNPPLISPPEAEWYQNRIELQIQMIK